MRQVYLCGPITGLTAEEARYDWREDVSHKLSMNMRDGRPVLERFGGDPFIRCLSPMRNKDHLNGIGVLGPVADYPGGSPLSTARGIVARDRYDTQRCDLVFCNLLGAKKVSIGSMIELGWCDSKRIPLVLVMEKDGNPHEHAMVRELADFHVTTVDDGIAIAKAILVPGV